MITDVLISKARKSASITIGLIPYSPDPTTNSEIGQNVRICSFGIGCWIR